MWSKIIILCSLPLADTSPERQEMVEDMAVKMFRHGDKCVLYNLSFCNVWKDWDSTKTGYLRRVIFSIIKENQNLIVRMAREHIPEEMLSLSRTARNFSFLLPFVDKVAFSLIYFDITPTPNKTSGLTQKWPCTSPPLHTPTTTTNSMSAISQQLLTHFWPNFKGSVRFLDLQQYLKQKQRHLYWPDFDQTLKLCFNNQN